MLPVCNVAWRNILESREVEDQEGNGNVTLKTTAVRCEVEADGWGAAADI